ncbi:hypothetical protein ACQP3J_28945, partial [Escherichia coli]
AKDTVRKTNASSQNGKRWVDRGLITQIYNELKKLATKTPNNAIKRWSAELNREFSTEESKMAERHLRKCSTSLAIREMQLKTTLRYHLTTVRYILLHPCQNG